MASPRGHSERLFADEKQRHVAATAWGHIAWNNQAGFHRSGHLAACPVPSLLHACPGFQRAYDS